MTGIDGRVSIAQTLPHDILCELYQMLAEYDPPTRKSSSSYVRSSHAARRPGAPAGKLSPSWSTMGIDSERNHNPALLSTARLVGKRDSLGWIKLTHVCEHWRTAGLSLAPLWANIFPVFPDSRVCETILARSRDVPLSLDMDLAESVQPAFFSPPHTLAFFELAKQHIERASTLTFPGHLNKNVKPQWNTSILQDVHLAHLKTLRVHTVQAGAQDFTLKAPALVHLVLDAFAPSLATSSLRYLKMTGEATCFRPARSVLDVLRETPLLEELSIQWTSMYDDLYLAAELPSVALPRLVSAEFSGPALPMGFIKYLEVPNNTSLSFFARYDPNLGQSILPILEILLPFLREPAVDHMSFAPASYTDICLSSSYDSHNSPTPRITLRVVSEVIFKELGANSKDVRSMAHFLARLMARMKPTNIVSFHTSAYTLNTELDHAQEDELVSLHATMLHKFTHLNTMSISWIPARYQPFFAALGLSEAIAFETFELETLIIYSEDTLPGYDKDPSTPKVIMPAIESVRSRWEEIISVLERRTNAGRQLKRLVLKGLRADEGEFGSLNAEGLCRAAQLVAEVVDDRMPTAA